MALVHPRAGPVGGVEGQILELSARLVAAGHEVHYFCNDRGDALDPRIHLHRLPNAARPFRALRVWLFDRLSRRAIERAGPFDVVHGFGKTSYQDVYRDGSGCLADFRAYLVHSAPSAWRRSRLRVSPRQWVTARIERARYRPGRCLRVLPISALVRGQILHRYALAPDDLQVIHPAVDLERFAPEHAPAARAAVRGELGLTTDEPLLAFVGSDYRRKGLDFVLKALPRLPDVHVLVLGSDRPDRAARYRALATRLGVRRRVHFRGTRSDPERQLAAADCLVYPSRFDAFGNSVLEAMACGLPTVVSRRAGSAEVVIDGKTGSVVEPEDVAALAAAIRPFLDPAQRAEAGRLARQEAEKYGWDRHFERVLEVYRGVVEDRARAVIRRGSAAVP